MLFHILLLILCIHPSLTQLREKTKPSLHHVSRKIHQSIYEQNSMAGKKIIILPSYVLGLANRLRTISSIAAIAHELNRKLIVIWAPSIECNSEAYELFTLNSEDISILPLPDMPNSGTSTNDMKQNMMRIIMEVNLFREIELRENVVDVEQLGESPEADVLSKFNRANNTHLTVAYQIPSEFMISREKWESISANILLVWTLTAHAMSPAEYQLQPTPPLGHAGSDQLLQDCIGHNIMKSQLFYQYLEPSPPVQFIIRQYEYAYRAIAKQPNSHTIGIHIRAYDASHDWSVIPPIIKSHGTGEVDLNAHTNSIPHSCQEASLRNHSNSLRFDQVSAIDDIYHMIARLIVKEENIVVIVSNSYALKELLLNSDLDNSRIVILVNTHQDSHSRSTVSGMQHAMADFLLLSGYSDVPIDVIIHTRGSSFASEASVLRNTPLIEIFAAPGETPNLEYLVTNIGNKFGSQCLNGEYLRTIYSHQCIVRNEEADNVCKSLFACYFESDYRCMCTVLLPYVECSLETHSSLNYLALPLRCISTSTSEQDLYSEKDLLWVYAESSGRTL